MRRALRVLIAVTFVLTVILGSAGGVAAEPSACSVDATDDVGTLVETCSVETSDVGIACGGSGGDLGGGGGC